MCARDWRDMAGVDRILAAGGDSACAWDEQKESLEKGNGHKQATKQPIQPEY